MSVVNLNLTLEKSVELVLLPLELQLQILYLCDLQSLGRLSQTCRKLNQISSDEILWRKILSKTLLPVSGPSLTSSHLQRIRSIWKSLPAKGQFYLLDGFKKNKSEKIKATRLHLLTSGRSDNLLLCMQKITIDNRGVWTSNADTVFRVPWNFKSGSLTVDEKQTQRFRRCTDPAKHVSDFVVDERYLVTGHWDGSVCFGESGKNAPLTSIQPHLSDVHSVVLHENILASGSRDFTFSVYDIKNAQQLWLANFQERIWSLAMCCDSSVIAVGTSGTEKTPIMQLVPQDHSQLPRTQSLEAGNLRIFDFERGIVLHSLRKEFRHGFGILALQFLNSQTLISGGHDGLLSYWDLRQNQCVLQLDSDADSAVYCFSTDGQSTILTGHANYNTVCFWDKRYARYPIRTKFYQQDRAEAYSSCSVYGLAFSPFEIYLGLADGAYKTPFCSA